MVVKFKNNVIYDIYGFIKMNNIEKIYLDIDGVIFHSCQAVCDILNEMQGTGYKGSDIISWNFREICSDLSNRDIEKIFGSGV